MPGHPRRTPILPVARVSRTVRVQRFGRLAELGVVLNIVDLPDVHEPGLFDLHGALCREIEPLGRPTLTIPRAIPRGGHAGS